MDLHSKNKRDLVEQIGGADRNLNELKKKSMTTMVTTSSSSSDKNKE